MQANSNNVSGEDKETRNSPLLKTGLKPLEEVTCYKVKQNLQIKIKYRLYSTGEKERIKRIKILTSFVILNNYFIFLVRL